MNPFNLLINYIMATSRASYYNVPGNQEVTNTGILAGMISDNPLMSYLLIENKAKIEGDSNSAHSVVTLPVSTAPVVTPPSSGANPPAPPSGTATPPATTGTATADGVVNIVAFEAFKTEISKNNEAVKGEIAAVRTEISKNIEAIKAEISTNSTNITTEFNKKVPEGLIAKLEVFEKTNAELKASLSEIKARLEEVLKATAGKGSLQEKPAEDVKAQSKTNQK